MDEEKLPEIRYQLC